jgi:hypothetical protein
METLGKSSFPKEKQLRNSLPNMSSISQHFAMLNPLSSFSTTSFVTILTHPQAP